jgi:hypothetical protein
MAAVQSEHHTALFGGQKFRVLYFQKLLTLEDVEDVNKNWRVGTARRTNQ